VTGKKLTVKAAR